MQTDSWLPQSLGKIEQWQHRQVFTSAYAPAIERFRISMGGESTLTGRGPKRSASSPGAITVIPEKPRAAWIATLQVRGYRYVYLQTQFRRAPRKFPRDIFLHAK